MGRTGRRGRRDAAGGGRPRPGSRGGGPRPPRADRVGHLGLGPDLVAAVAGGEAALWDLHPDTGRIGAVETLRLEKRKIRSLQIGSSHVLLLTADGRVYRYDRKLPLRPIDGLRDRRVIQVACGDRHSMALTRDGELFSWGDDEHGQLGLERAWVPCPAPQRVCALAGVPLARMEAGGAHSLALSATGAVFAWGRNDRGQLGLGHAQDVRRPTPVTALEKQTIVSVSCGEEHTAVLTQDGLVLTFGAGTHGQLGHNSTRSQPRPRLVAELFGSRAAQIACGRSHTLIHVPATGRVYSCGRGNGDPRPRLIPRPLPVRGPPDAGEPGAEMELKMIAGGPHSLFLWTAKTHGYVNPSPPIPTATAEKAERWSADVGTERWRDTKDDVKLIFSSPACVNGSFLESRGRRGRAAGRDPLGLDMAAVSRFFRTAAGQPPVLELVHRSLAKLLPSLPPRPASAECLRAFLIVPELLSPAGQTSLRLAGRLAGAVSALRPEDRRILESAWASLPRRHFQKLVETFREAAREEVRSLPREESRAGATAPPSTAALEILQTLYEASSDAEPAVPHGDFHVPEIAQAIERSQRSVSRRGRRGFSTLTPLLHVLPRSPCAFRQRDKTFLHRLEISSSAPPCYTITVGREGLLENVLRHLEALNRSVTVPRLDVRFSGEPGSGPGPTQEFFTLAFRELCSPHTRIFKIFPDSQLLWFSGEAPARARPAHVGTLLGSALFNGMIADVPFPLALYKKLLGAHPTLDDLRELCPTEGRTCQLILREDDDEYFQDLMLNFTIVKEQAGSVTCVELKEDGANLPVTRHNRAEYVAAYVDYVFNGSVDEEFEAFARGFAGACPTRCWTTFLPGELRAVVDGHVPRDWTRLEKSAKYRDYEETDDTVRNFWSVFHELQEEMKKKFLAFLTGADRLPAWEWERLEFWIVERVEESPDLYLPEAQTCLRKLLLPRYSSREVLRDRLLRVLQHPQRFGCL
ncbi:E3 ISG15--protein ligase HERC5-like [Ornithorhynchus anatinus]|uniref:E3 ISG15--protein ligase HERC5-like n=1 Tax=Ornithorhynchus anatinus TaxID=9258 RepID=UPI0010A7F376|nr:E3 ISG15--protein ligase HERC5-like [Ornithorhynchus anatinus]